MKSVVCLLFVFCCVRRMSTSSVCSGTADNVQVCSHCTFADKASCMDMASEMIEVADVAVCRAKCYAVTSCGAFLYDADNQMCWNMLPTCAGFAYTPGNLYIHRNTCNSDCLSFTLDARQNTKLAFSDSLYSDKVTSMAETDCVTRCFDTASCYLFSYGPGPYWGDNRCSNHFDCDSTCQGAVSEVNDYTVYARTCTVGCGGLSDIPDGAVDTSSGETYGATATYTCDTGYTLAGSDTRNCQVDAAWSGSAPTCNIVNCGDLSSITNGAVETSAGKSNGTMVTYTCDTGYTMTGSGTRTCQAGGSWAGSEPTCTIVTCRGLSDIPDGAVDTSSGETYGATATYTCDTVYTLAGSDTRTCQADAAWSGIAPTCNIVSCGGLSDIPNGAVDTSSGETYGATATYTCDTGYTLAGIDTRTCQADEAWSGSAPTCNIVTTVPAVPLTASEQTALTAPGSTLSMSTPTSAPAPVYIRPCLCSNNSFDGMTQEEIIEELIAAIQIDTKNTSLARNKRMCMQDGRTSSTMIGVVGITFMAFVFGGMLVFDLLTFFKSRDVCYVHQGIKRNS